jgi:hypothetical protein
MFEPAQPCICVWSAVIGSLNRILGFFVSFSSCHLTYDRVPVLLLFILEVSGSIRGAEAAFSEFLVLFLSHSKMLG